MTQTESTGAQAMILSDGDDSDIDSDVMNEPCAVCCSSGNEDDCLLCDTCDMAMHYNCVGLSCIPAGDWSCPWCVKKTAPGTKEVLFTSRC
jgi:NuA3 HAT complex component NTO1